MDRSEFISYDVLSITLETARFELPMKAAKRNPLPSWLFRAAFKFISLPGWVFRMRAESTANILSKRLTNSLWEPCLKPLMLHWAFQLCESLSGVQKTLCALVIHHSQSSPSRSDLSESILSYSRVGSVICSPRVWKHSWREGGIVVGAQCSNSLLKAGRQLVVACIWVRGFWSFPYKFLCESIVVRTDETSDFSKNPAAW